MKIEYSPDIGALYVRLGAGDIAETVEIGDDVYPDIYADLDVDGRPVGIEVLDAGAFFPFLARHLGTTEGIAAVELPDGLTAIVLDRDQVPAA